MNFLFKNTTGGGGGGSYTFSTGLTNNTNVITSNLSTGIAGGQSVIGGANAGDSLTIVSTKHATKGKIYFGTAHNSQYDEVSDYLGIGTNSVAYRLTVSDLTGTIGQAKFSGYSVLGGPFGTHNGTISVGDGMLDYVAFTSSDWGWNIGSVDGGGFHIVLGSTRARVFNVYANKVIGVNTQSPLSQLHISSATGDSNTAPLQFDIGVVEAHPRNGIFEYSGAVNKEVLTFVRSGTLRGGIPVGNLVSGVFAAVDLSQAWQTTDEFGNTLNLAIVS